MIRCPAERVAGKRGIAHDEGGATAVEFAIVSSVLIVLCLGIMQFGIALQIRSELGRAADTAVRVVMLDPKLPDSDFQAEAYKALPGYNQDKLSVQVGQTKVGSTDFRTLQITYSLGMFVPGLPSDAISLSVSRQTPVL